MSLGTKVGLVLGHIVLHGYQAPRNVAQPPPDFRPMYIVAKQSSISATAKHLLVYLSLCFYVYGSVRQFF